MFYAVEHDERKEKKKLHTIRESSRCRLNGTNTRLTTALWKFVIVIIMHSYYIRFPNRRHIYLYELLLLLKPEKMVLIPFAQSVAINEDSSSNIIPRIIHACWMCAVCAPTGKSDIKCPVKQ